MVRKARPRILLMRVLGLVACAAMAGLAACASSDSPKKETHDLAVTVLTAAQEPVANLSVKAWILDADVPGDSRTPIELEARVTDGEGRVEWTYESFEAPYFVGYEVRAIDGTVLTEAAPLPAERLNVAPGQLTVVLP